MSNPLGCKLGARLCAALALLFLGDMGEHDTVERDINPARDASERVYEAAPIHRLEHAEGALTRMIEQQTAKVPSDVFLVAAFGAMAASLGLELTGRRKWSRFIGMWPAPLLVMGVYNKLVKILGPR